MALQTGPWTANVGGTITTLNIASVGSTGLVLGTFGSANCAGYWDEDQQTLTLAVYSQSLAQLFTGYCFVDSVNLAGVSGSVFFTLAGIVEGFSASFGFAGPLPTAKRSTFGWYAQIGVD
ncbi:MAG: hypothetical protein WB609_00180 [Candidatus Cybelea sp.]